MITGAGGCHNSGNPKSEVMVFVEDDSEQTMYIVERLGINSYIVRSYFYLHFDIGIIITSGSCKC